MQIENIPEAAREGAERPKWTDTRRTEITPGLTSNRSLESQRCNSCGKICKNAIDLKIHQTEMGREQSANLLQRAEILSCKTEMIHSQEEYHRVDDVNATGTAEEVNIPIDVSTSHTIKWPRMNDNISMHGKLLKNHQIVYYRQHSQAR